MGSSPTAEPLVDTDDSDPPSVDVADTVTDGPGSRPASTTSEPPASTSDAANHQPRHSPVVLVIDVVRMLRGRGLKVTEAHAYSSEAISACAQLLRCIGVQPHHFAARRAEPHGPIVTAAATLMRAAGIESNSVVTWPGRST
jgi:hypothetical protein